MAKEHLIIIGNGMAAGRLLGEILERDADRYRISLFGDEPHGNYNRIMLSPVLAGEMSADEIMLNPLDWYAKHGIELYSGDPVVEIDRASQQVFSASGRCLNYDKLVIATGSSPLLPAGTPNDLEGVLSFRTLGDVAAIKQAAEHCRHALVIGGGLLGLEAAYGLRQSGCDVTVLHRGEWLLNRQLDEAAAGLLADELKGRGIDLRLDAEAERFIGNDRIAAVHLNDGSTLNVQLVVIAIGISPNAGLARRAGLACERGILVDEQLQSSDPAIYALGECCQFDGQTFGLVAPIWDQTRVLADQLCGFNGAPYRVRPTATKLKVSGIDLFSAGEFISRPEYDSQVYRDPELGHYRKLLFHGRRLVGAVLYGDVADGNQYFELIEQQADVEELRPWLMFGVEFARQQAARFSTAAPVSEPVAVSSESFSPIHNNNIPATTRPTGATL
ncbi:NAD(P)/FAD-dependent oxidoreductase [Marinobacterium arenosum]|uniref:NAD(P)/FAD-dependent oxidoreductase n=1 Tax=Marinobacterium arenosum TaxID=2862496 RepID=UPI001C9830BC|nr:FAD-dependent oxidoreductase [Marinobacterium arenosum]MBY4675779.1 FAD-dependent oxidoreductase [Marinobacterium arenosum]